MVMIVCLEAVYEGRVIKERIELICGWSSVTETIKQAKKKRETSKEKRKRTQRAQLRKDPVVHVPRGSSRCRRGPFRLEHRGWHGREVVIGGGGGLHGRAFKTVGDVHFVGARKERRGEHHRILRLSFHVHIQIHVESKVVRFR